MEPEIRCFRQSPQAARAPGGGSLIGESRLFPGAPFRLEVFDSHPIQCIRQASEDPESLVRQVVDQLKLTGDPEIEITWSHNGSLNARPKCAEWAA